MLAFGTLFSCQGAGSSAKPKRLRFHSETALRRLRLEKTAPTSDVRQVGDVIATPIQADCRFDANKRRPGQWVTGGFSGRTTNSNDSPGLVKSIDQAGKTPLSHLENPADQVGTRHLLTVENLAPDPDRTLLQHAAGLGS
jgi:hypothetical protein